MTAYLVVLDGAGELDSDFTVIVTDAESELAAVTKLTGPAYSYGKSIAYVASLENVSIFELGTRVVPTATPVPFGDVVQKTPASLRQYLDPDGLVHSLSTLPPRPSRPIRDTPQA